MIVILYSIIVIPYRLAAHVDAEGGWLVVETIFDVFFGLDLVLNFFTCYFDERSGELETDFKAIVKKYLKGWFLVDFLSTLPMDALGNIFFEDSEQLRGARLLRSFRLVKLVRLSRLMKVDELLESFAHSTGINTKMVLLISLSFNQLLFAHLFACLWLGVSSPRSSHPECKFEYDHCETECEIQNSWIFSKNIQCNAPQEQYVVALYWAFATMTTVGYGDVFAINDLERIVSIFLMLIGVTVFGYSILMVALIINEGDPRASIRKRKVAHIEEFLIRIKASSELRKKIRRHFEALTQIRDVTLEDNSNLLYFLDPLSRTKLRHSSFLPFQKKVANMFRDRLKICKQDLVADLCTELRITQVEKEEILFEENCVASNLYILLSGSVELWFSLDKHTSVIVSDNQRSLEVLSSPKIFGEVSIIMGSLRSYSATSISECKIAYVFKKKK